MKFIYRALHACIEFKLKISDRKKSFPCSFDNLNWSVKPSWLRTPQTVESNAITFLNLNLKRNRGRRRSVQKIRSFIWRPTSCLVFRCKLCMCMLSEKLCYWYLCQWKAKLFITFVIARVSSSRLKAAINRKPWFTWFPIWFTIEHRFSNSVDQSERA